ncbi:hypothetical protein H6G74_03740 [Nostoc spongiaeforme FACHB-130]|uniref:Uncharacterized protein n=1 Tax=Nostoc spongiaeforme FACHB-130 TaxID=1357510 RepID=A0ABR8FSY0_9NOSO|nr:hypothetical protein [Nostoc spongiaeforme]MBD2593440.1 hypothetical protein [Nostoc spongiaeforme FACHB-130]
MSRFRFPNFLTTIRAIIIVLCGLMTFSILGYAAYRIYQELFRERHVGDIVNLETDSDVKVQFSLNSFEVIKGTPYLMSTISSQQNYRQSYYEKEAASIRNFLFFNTSDQSAWKLIPNNNSLFVRYQTLGLSTPPENVIKKVQGIWYEVVTADSDGDKRLTASDRKTIAVSDFAGKNYTEVIRQVDQVLGTHQPNEATFLVFYTSDAKNFVTEINIPKRKVVVTKPLPPLE